MTTLPHCLPPVWPDIAPGRFAATIRRDDPAGCSIALVGLPDDLGVRLNNGRPGAATGPRAFRAALAKYGTSYDSAGGRDLSAVRVFDAGDVIPETGSDAAALNATHERVTEALRAVHALGLVPVCIGGGHDMTFPTVRALSRHIGGPVGGINVDPHLDVRDTPGSGMPFRALIEGGHLDPRRYTTLGVGPFANLREHVEYLRSRGGHLAGIDDLTLRPAVINEAFMRAAGAGPAFMSVDLDSIDGASAPGVSAVNPQGLTVGQVCALARRAGASPAIRHFDIMELSPPNDDPPWNSPSNQPVGRTARIAALVFLSFLSGFAERSA